jgi:uncharacterized protein with PIN domain
METKTCPHCNEPAIREESWDVSYSDEPLNNSHALECWVCYDCSRMFYTHTDKEELNETI